MSYDNVTEIRCNFHKTELHCDVTREPDGPQSKIREPIVADEVDVNSLREDKEQYTGKGIDYDFSGMERVSCGFIEREGGNILKCEKADST